MGDDRGGLLISPDEVMPIWMVGVSACVILSCIVKARRSLFFLTPAHMVSPRKRAVKWLCVCMCACVTELTRQAFGDWQVTW